MKIDPVNPGNAYGWQKPHTREQETEETTPDRSVGTEATAVAETSEGDRGVIRLLQQGHFNGVADLRLRINFHDELTAIQTAARQAVTAEKSADVTAAVEEAVAAFTAENELTEDQALALAAAHEAFQQTAAQAGPELLANAFQTFIEALIALSAPPEPETTPPEAPQEPLPEEPPLPLPPEEPPLSPLLEEPILPLTPENPPLSSPLGEPPLSPPPEEPPLPLPLEEPPLSPPLSPPLEEPPLPLEETGPDFQTFIETLQEVFTAAIDTLTNAVSSTTTLPPLSEPNGNGVAYSKFLAIYNELYGIQPDAQAVDTTEPAEQ